MSTTPDQPANPPDGPALPLAEVGSGDQPAQSPGERGRRIVRVFGAARRSGEQASGGQARPDRKGEEQVQAPTAASSAKPPAKAADPVVSFIIPCYNHGRFVREAVESCLKQAGCEPRVVVVNDGSDDGNSKQACDACRGLPGWVEVIHQPNRGLPAARNAGAERAAQHAGDYLVFLDADDTIEHTFARRLSAEIARAGADAASGVGPGVVSHAYCQERLTDKAFGIWTVPAWDPTLLLITNLHPVTALIRRECFEAVGGFDETMRRGYEDWDLWLRFAARSWRGLRVREPLFNWRRHSDTTMVMEAVTRHEELFRSLVAKHADLYSPKLAELVIRSNVLLRKADANWLDENLDAIYVRDLRARNIELVGEAESARKHAEELREDYERKIARLAAEYEQKPALRWSRRLHETIDRLPGPLAAPFRGLLRLLRGRAEP
ncbi:MAG: glycosyltransferase family 2 protein [Phycisphaeraceae bacterium]|nr:glycosyltransferase family 2 protein [Phycisphaeraceae bacterium]